MKRLLIVAVGLLALAGCSTTAQQQTLSRADQVKQSVALACPVLKAVLAGAQQTQASYPQVALAAQQLDQPITTLCAQTAVVDTSSIQQLVSTTIPALQSVVNSTDMKQSVKDGINVGLTTASVLLAQIVAIPTTPTTTPPATPQSK